MDEYNICKEESYGTLIPELLLIHMMDTCTDFENEVSQIEHVSQGLGTRVIITMEYHAEYSVEGIKYFWGYSKSLYRRHTFSEKKGKEKFDALVDKCISRDLITMNMVSKFRKRSRGYMLAYRAL